MYGRRTIGRAILLAPLWAPVMTVAATFVARPWIRGGTVSVEELFRAAVRASAPITATAFCATCLGGVSYVAFLNRQNRSSRFSSCLVGGALAGLLAALPWLLWFGLQDRLLLPEAAIFFSLLGALIGSAAGATFHWVLHRASGRASAA